MGIVTKENYDAVSEAIIVRAAEDYRSALKRLKNHPDSRAAHGEIRNIEKFFRSSEFEMMTDLNPDYLIRMLKKEAGI